MPQRETHHTTHDRWGEAALFFAEFRRRGWFDLLLLVGFVGAIFGLLSLAGEWRTLRPAVHIDLSPRALPLYVFYSLCRGLLAYVSGQRANWKYVWRDRKGRNLGVAGDAGAVVAISPDGRGLVGDYQGIRVLDWWQRLRWVELPFATIGLVWNSMMSMAGGWFFLMINESFILGQKDFRLPGIGSYMSVAVAKGDIPAMLWAIFAMVLMIVVLDQLLWRPVVVWSQKFRVEEGAEEVSASSWFYDWIRRSLLIDWIETLVQRARERRHVRRAAAQARQPVSAAPSQSSTFLSLALFGVLMLFLVFGGWRLFALLRQLPFRDYPPIFRACGWTLGRVLISTAIGTLWTLPAGLAIGLSPRLSRIFQPVVQVAASFPAPMLFPLVITVLSAAGVSLGWGSVVLMLLGTQWYILFNVIAGAMAIPSDLRETALSYRFDLKQRFKTLYLPAVFPYLVTGWVTAAGGAWNASIVAEIMNFKGRLLTTNGLGALISRAAERADFPHLAAGVTVMAIVVVLFNRTVWKRLYRMTEERFSLSK